MEWAYTSFYPDSVGPVIRMQTGAREIAMMRWGFPKPPNLPGPPLPVTNVRYTKSSYWRAWLKPENRCLVPFTSFSEYAPEPAPITKKKDVVWFAKNDNRPPMAFAGIWRPWTGVRGTNKAPIEGDHLLYSFLTTVPNEVVAPIHPKAMPVILDGPESWDIWLNAPVEVALELQKPVPADMIHIVARVTNKED